MSEAMVRGSFGWTGIRPGDLMEMGVLDPRKVTRTALQNAASIAGLILTTACIVAAKPQPPGAAQMPMPEM